MFTCAFRAMSHSREERHQNMSTFRCSYANETGVRYSGDRRVPILTVAVSTRNRSDNGVQSSEARGLSRRVLCSRFIGLRPTWHTRCIVYLAVAGVVLTCLVSQLSAVIISDTYYIQQWLGVAQRSLNTLF